MIALAPVKAVPVSVTGTAVPRTPEFGLIEVKVGVATANTVKFTLLLVPPRVVTLTVRVVSAAKLAIVKVAVTDVSLTGVMPLTVIPVPETVTVDVVSKLVPVRVT